MSENETMLGRFASRLRQEFSPDNMQARARRREALANAQIHFDLWADYGDPHQLAAANEFLRQAD